MREHVYLYLPRDIVRELPGIFLDRLQGTSGVLSVDADGFNHRARLEHPSDDPRAALDLFTTLAREYAARLREDLEIIEADLRAAEDLRKNLGFLAETADPSEDAP